MNFAQTKALIWIFIQSLPKNYWPFLLLSVFQFTIFSFLSGERSGLENCLNQITPLMFSVLLGVLFFSQGATSGTPGSLTCVPHAEFLLTRPIPSAVAYRTAVTVCFLFMILGPLLSFGLSMRSPDLQLSLYHSKAQKTEAYEKLDVYRSAFPESRIVKLPKSYHDTLVIPHGWNLIQGWQLWIAILCFLALQAMLLVKLPPKIQTMSLTAVSIGFIAPYFYFVENGSGLENLFFLFARHWIVISAVTLLVFISVQLCAKRRVSSLDIVS